MSARSEEPRAGRSLRAGFSLYFTAVILAIFPFSPEPALDIKFFLTSCAACLLSLGWVLSLKDSNSVVRVPRVFFAILVALVSWNLLTGLASSHPGNSTTAVARFCALFLLYFIAAQAYREAMHVQRAMLVICCAAAAATLYGFCQRAGLDPFPWEKGARYIEAYSEMPATFGNGNVAGYALTLIVIMGVYLAATRRFRWCAALVILALIHVYFIRQRSPVVSLLAAGALVAAAKAVERLGAKRPHRMILCALLAVAVLGAGVVGGLLAYSRYVRGRPTVLDSSLILRYNGCYGAARMMFKRPLLGYGTGNYPMESVPFWTPYEKEWFASESLMNYNVHCDVLEFGAEGGLIAAALYLLFLTRGVYAGLLMAFTAQDSESRRLGYAFAALFFAFLIDGLFGFNMRVPVTGALIFVTAGFLDGVYRAANGPRRACARKTLRYLWPAAVALLALGTVSVGTAVFASQLFLQRGRGAKYWGAFETAKQMFKRGARFAPWDWTFPHEEGRTAFDQQDWEQAIRCYKRALWLSPHSVPVLAGLSSAYFNLGLDFLTDKAGTQAASDGALLAFVAFNHATENAQRALALCEPLSEPHETLAQVAFIRANELPVSQDGPSPGAALWKEVELHARAALRFGKIGRAQNLRLLASACLALNKMDEAEAALVRAASVLPVDEQTWSTFFQFAQRYRRFDRMLESLQTATERMEGAKETDPNALAAGHFWLARVHADGYGNVQPALRLLSLTLERAPLRVDYWRFFGAFCLEQGCLDVFRAHVLKMRATLAAQGRQLPPPTAALAHLWERGPDALADTTLMVLAALEKNESTAGGMEHPTAPYDWVADILAHESGAAPLGTANLREAHAQLAEIYGRLGNPKKAEEQSQAASMLSE